MDLISTNPLGKSSSFFSNSNSCKYSLTSLDSRVLSSTSSIERFWQISLIFWLSLPGEAVNRLILDV